MRGPKFKINPDPPIAGQPATITYDGAEKQVVWGVLGGRMNKSTVPPRDILIDPVPSGERLVITDDSGGEESGADWPIVEQNEHI